MSHRQKLLCAVLRQRGAYFLLEIMIWYLTERRFELF
jgi:hypothetical protein